MIRSSLRGSGRCLLVLAIVLLLAASSFAQKVTGTVTNRTTSKAAANVEVTLLTLSNGMSESASTKTDSEGRYSMPMSSAILVPSSHRGSSTRTNI